jgi:hypothetical protein
VEYVEYLTQYGMRRIDVQPKQTNRDSSPVTQRDRDVIRDSNAALWGGGNSTGTTGEKQVTYLAKGFTEGMLLYCI